MAQAETDSEQLVKSYVKALNVRDYSTLTSLVSDSFEMHDPGAPEGVVHGRDGLETFMRDVVDAFPDFEITIFDILSDETTVMYEAEMTMTHEGEFDGIPPTGETVKVREMTKWRIEDGNINELRVYFDQQEILHQLGLVDD